MKQALIDKGFSPKIAEKIEANTQECCRRAGTEAEVEFENLSSLSARGLLYSAFIWSESPEGFSYWNSLSLKLREEKNLLKGNQHD